MPKNLVLFSDGTGNSSGKLFKTNVWRVYEAVDLTDPEDPKQPRQFAFYDDGVGTSSFKPLAVLGGAFGVGLSRNVLDLYVFLCRMYEPGDRIYAFGFSRGAFTIRVLLGLVMTEGLLRYHGSEGELQRLARDAYRSYRRKRFKGNFLVEGARALRDAWLARWNGLLDRKAYSAAERIGRPPHDDPDGGRPDDDKPIEVEFVGLWDTVDAYGLPVDELTRAIDRWIWPLTMRDYNLNRRVHHARHALSVDDERNSFHPRLWNERPDPDDPNPDDPERGVRGGNLTTTHITEERVSQVWFAGVHANVGGGYPDDSLAYVPLQWMMTEANRYGLRFEKKIWDAQIALSDENGPIYDPRHGLGGYYRYNPRRIEKLTQTPLVNVDRTKIHESVLRRIQVGHDGYAPITLPPGFAVMKIDGSIVEGDEYLRTMKRGRAATPPRPPPSKFRSALIALAERVRSPQLRMVVRAAAAIFRGKSGAASIDASVGDALSKGHAGAASSGAPLATPLPVVGPGAAYKEQQEHVYNWVWHRRIAYFVTLAITLALVGMPLFAPGNGACAGTLCFLAAPIAMLGRLLPSMAETWTESFASHPNFSLAMLVLLGYWLRRGGALEARLRDEMRRVWYAVPNLKPSSAPDVPKPVAPRARELRIERLRNSGAYQAFFHGLTHFALPGVFFLALGFALFAFGSQLVFALRSSAGDVELLGRRAEIGVCRPVGAWSATSGTRWFDPRSACASTGVQAEKGATYRVRIIVPNDQRWRWSDRTIPAGPNGFECPLDAITSLALAPATLLRRHLAEQWFQPMARIDATGNDTYPLRGDPRTAPRHDRCKMGNDGKPGPAAPVVYEGPPPPCPSAPPPAMDGGEEVFESRFVARSSGKIFVYLNDAVEVPFYSFYDNNRGCARIETELVTASRDVRQLQISASP